MEKIISASVPESASYIREIIDKSKSILLHFHPSPDPDSVGSSLAMKFALESLGKRVTVIKGDSEIPDSFNFFPGIKDVVKKTFLEIDQKDFDLFLILDSAALQMISRRGEVRFIPELNTIVIDHHASNQNYADFNLVANRSSAAEVVFDLIKEWNIPLDRNMAENLYLGMYSDTGGFRYSGTNADTLRKASELANFIPNLSEILDPILNSNSPAFIRFEAAGLNAVKDYGKFALSLINFEQLQEMNVPESEARTSEISSFLKTVSAWEIVGSGLEVEKGKIKWSFRSKDALKYDVTRIAQKYGGGGHRNAAGAIYEGDSGKAQAEMAQSIKEMYNL